MTKRELIQQEALSAIVNNNFEGVYDIAPRVGKSKIAIDAIKVLQKKYSRPLNVLITVPLNEIITSWDSEFKTWDLLHKPTVINQRSIHKEALSSYDLIIFDEVHTLSQNQVNLINESLIDIGREVRLLGLSGSISTETKSFLKNELGLTVRYTYSIEQAISDGIISNFHIYCYRIDLDNTSKYILCGNKGKERLVTEREAYKFYSDKFEYFKKIAFGNPKMSNVKMKYAGDRANLIYTSRSKFDACKLFLTEGKRYERVLLFTARTAVADNFCDSFHSKSPQDNLEKFVNGDIQHLAVCNMVNMGITIPNLKNGIFHQMQSNEESAIQKMLRMCNLEGENEANLVIFCYKNTVDEDWVKSALTPFSSDKITWLE